MVAARLRHLSLLAVLVVVLGHVSGVQARRGHHHHHLHNFGGVDREQQPGKADQSNVTSPQPEAGGIAAAAAQMIRACSDEAVKLQKMPVDWVLETVQPNDDQRTALEQIRSAAADVGGKLDASCPKDLPAKLTERLDTMRASLDAIKAALLRLRPAFVSAYVVLSDEQKARLVARAISQRAQTADRAVDNQAQPVALDCRQWPAMLKSWPLGQIEGKLALSDEQLAALYALMAAIYRVTAGLAASCHDADALTPVSRLDNELGRIDALQQCVDAIAPALAGFLNVLNDAQTAQLNAILGMSPQAKPEATAR